MAVKHAPIDLADLNPTPVNEDLPQPEAIGKFKTIYKLRFWGEYYTHNKGEKKYYEFNDIYMTDKERKMGFLHVFVRQVLTDPNFINHKARVKYPDWKRHHTHHEDGVLIVNPDGTTTPVQEFGLMNRQQLTTFIKTKKLDIECDLYPSAAELKQAITEYRDNQQAFKAYQEKRKETMGDKLAAAKNLRTLNSWASKAQTDVEPENPQYSDPQFCIPKDLQEQDEINDFLSLMDEV